MVGVIARDHAYTAADASRAAAEISNANASNADPAGIPPLQQAAIAPIIAEDARRGVPVHAFDPDASPAEKAKLARQAGQAKAQLEALNPLAKRKKEAEKGLALGIDNSSKGGAPASTVTADDADAAEEMVEGMEGMPGGIAKAGAPAVPPWILTGWRQVAGLDTIEDQKQQIANSVLSAYLSEQMYGAWYHNAAIILFAVLATRFVTAIHLGFAWVLIILAFCAAYYNMSITRVRHRARDDIQRELVKTRLVTETESADWMNQFADRFWLIYEPILSQILIKTVDDTLAAYTPAFCESLRLTTFTLGNKAPRVDYVRTFPKTPTDVVIMDFAFSFTPNDLEDITKREARMRVNPRIVLTCRLGKGFVSKGLPVLLEDMSFVGRLRIKLKLIPTPPHVSTVEISFIEKPVFDFVLRPIGGDLGFDINNIPGLAPFIRSQVHGLLGPLMYDPNVFILDLEALFNGTALDTAVGVLEVHVLAARDIKATKLGGGAPDPYVKISLGAKETIARTKTIPSTNHPSWHEKHYILVNSLSDVLNLSVWDYNDRRADNNLGTASKELASLEDNATQEGIRSALMHDGKERGNLRYDLSFYPVLKPVEGPNGIPMPIPDTTTGIVRLTLHQAKDLDISGEHGHLNPYARVFLGSNSAEVHKTKTLKRTQTPVWESHCEFLVPDKMASKITVDILDSKGMQRDVELGRLTVSLADLLTMKERNQDWLPLSNSRGGKLRLTAQWKPVQMAGGISGAHDYVPPIGIFRVHLKRAIDVKNVEGTLGGKSDPYVRITGRNKVQAITLIQDNNLNPEWDEIVYFPVTNTKQHFVMELLDHQNIGKDRSLGHVELRSKDYIKENDGEDREKYPYTRIAENTRVERRDRIKLDKAQSYKGTLVYEVDFCPAVSLRGGVHFQDEAEKLQGDGQVHVPVNGNGNGGEHEDEREHGHEQGTVGEAVSAPVSAAVNGATGANGASGVNGASHGADGNGYVLGHQAAKPSLGGASIASVQTAGTANTANTAHTAKTTGTVASRTGQGEATEAERDDKGVVMSKQELVAAKAGVIVFQLISGELPRKGRVELFVDDAVHPAFISTKSRSARQKWDEIGEGFVREMEFSRLNLRINASDGEDAWGESIAEFACDTRDLLENCLETSGGTDLVLANANGSSKAKIKIAMRFLPVDIALEPRESINNMGILGVEVLSAHNLLAADRGGKSDPNITIHLNGHKVFKSETIKKTVNPEWNESFECVVRSRVAANMEFEIHDWDRVGSATHLGRGKIDLAAIVPFEVQEIRLPVVHDKLGEKGTLHLRLMFQPEIVSPEPERKGTFTTAGRVVTTVGGVPLAAGRLAGKGVLLGGKGVLMGGGAVAHGVGKGVGGIGKGVGAVGGFAGRKIGLIKKKDKEGHDILVPADQADGDLSVGPSPSGYSAAGMETLTEVGESATGQGERGPPPTEPGHLSVTVIGARGLKFEAGAKLKSHVAIKLGGKGHKTDHEKGLEPDWNETFTYNIAPSNSTLHIALHEHQLLGKDPVLAETEVDIWSYIDAYRTSDTANIALPDGVGTIILKLDWSTGTPSSKSLGRKRSMSSLASPSPAFASANGVDRDNASTTGSPGRFSALRMSMTRKHAHDE